MLKASVQRNDARRRRVQRRAHPRRRAAGVLVLMMTRTDTEGWTGRTGGNRQRRACSWPVLPSACRVRAVLRVRRCRPRSAAAQRRDPRTRRAAPRRRRRSSGGPASSDLGAPAGPDISDRLRSVVYLETAPRGAFEQTESGHAVMDQRNETFVPHVLAITTGTTVDFPNSDKFYHNVFSLSKAPDVRSRPLRRRPLEDRSASIGRASCACSATSTRT